MKEPEELEPMRKIDEFSRFSNKELRLVTFAQILHSDGA